MAEQRDSGQEYIAGPDGGVRHSPFLRIVLVAIVVMAAAGIAVIQSRKGHTSRFRLDRLSVAAAERWSDESTTTGPALPVSTTVAPATTTTSTKTARPAAPAPATATTRPVQPLSARISAAPAPATGYGCTYALAWLRSHAAPGFTFECPGYAHGHEGMTCVNIAGLCPGQKVIAIADPCPAAYMNEAHNSWIALGQASGPVDPYGYC